MAKILNKFFNNFNEITKYYNFLIKKTKNREYVDITNEWLIDNYYLLVEQKNNILLNKKDLKKYDQIIVKNYDLLKNIASKKKYNIDFKYLVDELKKYQKDTQDYFSYKEIDLIVPTFMFIYTDCLNSLCQEEYKRLLDRDNISNIIKNNDELTLDSFIDNDFDLEENGHYIFEINNQLYKIKNSAEIFKNLNEYLQEKQVSLKNLINDEYQNKIDSNVLISNIFNDIAEIADFSIEDLYEKVSKTEKILMEDSIYSDMTRESKNLYRGRITKLAKKNNVKEYDYVDSIKDDNHIGFKLFKHKNNRLRFIYYISFIFVVTSVICFLLSSYFIKYRVLGFIILFIPISQLVVQITNNFLTSFVQPNVIPKLDYTNGIPDDARTMVVIPTIVSNKAKIKEMFDTLESFYLVNKTDNLYFTLLGDIKAHTEKVADYDEEISRYGQEYAEKLNEKYKKKFSKFV